MNLNMYFFLSFFLLPSGLHFLCRSVDWICGETLWGKHQWSHCFFVRGVFWPVYLYSFIWKLLSICYCLLWFGGLICSFLFMFWRFDSCINVDINLMWLDTTAPTLLFCNIWKLFVGVLATTTTTKWKEGGKGMYNVAAFISHVDCLLVFLS